MLPGLRVIAIAVVLAAVLLFLRVRGQLEPDDRLASVASNIEHLEGADDLGRHSEQPSTMSPTWEDPAPLVAGDQQPNDQHGAIRRFKEINRYPSSSRRLTSDSTDLLNPNRRYEIRQPLPSLEANADLRWEVLLTADRYFVRGREPLQASLELWHDGRGVTPRGVVMMASRPGEEANVELSVQRTGAGISGSFVPGEHWPGYVGQVRVEARFSAAGLTEQTGSLPFYFTSIEQVPAEFTGKFSDRVSNGYLLVDVGMRVDREGSYRVEGNLFDLAGDPLAWAAFEDHLGAGQQDVTLKFYGLVLHDAGLAGPFVLQQVRGYRIRRGDSPHREDMADYQGEYHLAGNYDFADFTTADYDSPWEQRMLKFYGEALARGVQLTEPWVPGKGGTEQ